METEDINNLERITSKYKIRYDNLEVEYKNEIIGTKLYFVVNLTELVSEMYQFKSTLLNDTDFDLHCTISIMNLFAHYKHFYNTRGEVNRCTIIGFVKDGNTYRRFKQLLDMIVEVCNFFRDVYFLPYIYNGNYTHLVCACLIHMESYNTNKTIVPRVIHILSKYNIDKQIMNCIPTKAAHKFSKELSGKIKDNSKELMMTDIFKNDYYYKNSPYKSELDSLLIPIGKFMNSMICSTTIMSKRKAYEVKYNVSRSLDKLDLITEFLEKYYNIENDMTISSQFISFLTDRNLFKTELDREHYINYLKMYDFRMRNIGVLNTALAPLIETWKKKIKDYMMARDCEQYKLLIKHELYVDWL